MSNNNETQNIENADEEINWIEKAIDEKYIKFYEYEHFSSIQEIGSGAGGKVFRAKYNNVENYFALKFFFNINSATIKEIVREIKLQRDVDYHGNIIRFYGITKLESENKIHQAKSYLLVMEYADGGTLRNYLNENFNKLTWNKKYNLAYQLACAVSCLHDEGIVHRDLHSCNVLVNHDSIKLADFGLSKRIEEASKSKSKLLGMVPYIDPKSLMDSKNQTELKKKYDVYSIGVLLWEISSGIPPFHGEAYDFSLMYKILQGRREKIVPNTPDDYARLFTECWDDEPNNRPFMHDVVKRLKMFITVNEIVDLISKDCDKKKIEWTVINQYTFNNHNINPKEIYNWLLNNQNNSNSIFLLGYFNYFGIRTIRNYKQAFNLFINASEQNHLLAQLFVGFCYEYGNGTTKNGILAFKYFEKISNKDYALGYFKVGFCYEIGTGIKKDLKLAAYWYKKAANNGHLIAMLNLGNFYLNGNGVEKDHQKAFELFKKSAEGECSEGMTMLGYCYDTGIGIEIDKQKAVDLYREAAKLGDDVAQYNLGIMYERGDGIEKDIYQAIHWYEQSAKQGYQCAQNKLTMLKKVKE
ncbi:kinase-like domain-containing protein [Glomus cerebriforme]|uniref:Kinase-like domain-containing protein n=1 Tax=Glomus cerebriforme TaxID=658196 RepID=A0A397SY93_9GLOM|nr:kinase-like domain-containing protein [Glomus cerebriforme]